MTTVLAEAFGRLSPHQGRSVDVLSEDLYSIFLARSQLMGWSTINSSASPGETSLVWDMNEAEIDDNDRDRIGFAQVGLDSGGHPTDLVLAIPPIVQCLDDSIRWFGEAEVHAVQVTAFDIAPRRRSYLHRLVSVLNWFNIAEPPTGRSQALVTVAADGWDDNRQALAIADIRRTNTGSFALGSQIMTAAEHEAGPDWDWARWGRTGTGLIVSMPEWSPSTAGWVAARFFEAVLVREPLPDHLSVRVTRIASR